MGDYIALMDLAQRVPFKVQIDLADDKRPGENALTDQQEIDLRTAIEADNQPGDARLQRIVTILNSVIDDGEAKVNDYLRYQYTNLPLTGNAVTEIIKTHSLTYAAWYLYSRRQNVPEHIQTMFNNAERWGERFIPPDEESTPTVTTQRPRFKGGKRRWSQDSLREW